MRHYSTRKGKRGGLYMNKRKEYGYKLIVSIGSTAGSMILAMLY